MERKKGKKTGSAVTARHINHPIPGQDTHHAGPFMYRAGWANKLSADHLKPVPGHNV